MLKSIIAGILALALATVIIAPGISAAAQDPSPNQQTLVSLYTQLINLLQQELLALGGKAPSLAPPSCSPSFGNICLVNAAGVPIQPAASGTSHKKASHANSDNSTPPPAPYVAKAVHFDGGTWLINNSLVATDNTKASFSEWFYVQAPSDHDKYFIPWIVDPVIRSMMFRGLTLTVRMTAEESKYFGETQAALIIRDVKLLLSRLAGTI
jgi:hypothetical protein